MRLLDHVGLIRNGVMDLGAVTGLDPHLYYSLYRGQSDLESIGDNDAYAVLRI